MEGRRTECELQISGIPSGWEGVGVALTLEEGGVVWRMLGANNQITRTCRSPQKASLMPFAHERNIQRVGGGHQELRISTTKGVWLVMICSVLASPPFCLVPRSWLVEFCLCLSSVHQGAWQRLPFLGLCTFNQFWAAPFQIGLFMFDIKNSCWPISSFHRCSLGLNPSSLSDAH